ncbi:MAG: START domain-containing protein [Nevskia sp.]|nr:START domain-containing protein [Nevskia sp.]
MWHARRVVASLLLVLWWAAASADEAWRLEKDEDGIQIYSRAVDGWDIREIRGLTTFHGRLSSLVAVIDDPATGPALNKFVAESTVTQRDSDTRYRLYNLTRMPWPLSDRDVLNQREITQDTATHAVTIIDNATDGLLPPKNGLVRIVRSRQLWSFTPKGNGDVQVELRWLSDPNGPIPSTLINALSVSTPFHTIDRLRQIAQRPQYAQARLAFIAEP